MLDLGLGGAALVLDAADRTHLGEDVLNGSELGPQH